MPRKKRPKKDWSVSTNDDLSFNYQPPPRSKRLPHVEPRPFPSSEVEGNFSEKADRLFGLVSNGLPANLSMQQKIRVHDELLRIAKTFEDERSANLPTESEIMAALREGAELSSSLFKLFKNLDPLSRHALEQQAGKEPKTPIEKKIRPRRKEQHLGGDRIARVRGEIERLSQWFSEATVMPLKAPKPADPIRNLVRHVVKVWETHWNKDFSRSWNRPDGPKEDSLSPLDFVTDVCRIIEPKITANHIDHYVRPSPKR